MAALDWIHRQLRPKKAKIVLVRMNGQEEVLRAPVFEVHPEGEQLLIKELGDLKDMKPEGEIHLVIHGASVLEVLDESISAEQLIEKWLPEDTRDKHEWQSAFDGQVSAVGFQTLEKLKAWDLLSRYHLASMQIGLAAPLSVFQSNASEGDRIALFEEQYVLKNGSVRREERSGGSWNYRDVEYSDEQALVLASYHLSQQGQHLIPQGELGQRIQNTIARRLNKAALFAGAALLFVLMLGNYLWFNSLDEQKLTLTQQNTKALNVQKELDQLKEQQRVQSLLFGDAHQWRAERMSFVLDQAMGQMPESIQLSGLQIQPVEKKIRSEEPIQVEEMTVVVSGTAPNDTPIYEWLKWMNQDPLFQEVELTEFVPQRKKGFEFKMLLKVS